MFISDKYFMIIFVVFNPVLSILDHGRKEGIIISRYIYYNQK